MGFEQGLRHHIGHVLEEVSLRDASQRGNPWRGILKRGEKHKEALLERDGDSNRQGTHPQKEPRKRKGSGKHTGKISGNKHDPDLTLATALTITLRFLECLWFTTHSGIERRRKSGTSAPGHSANVETCCGPHSLPTPTHQCPAGQEEVLTSPRADPRALLS